MELENQHKTRLRKSRDQGETESTADVSFELGNEAKALFLVSFQASMPLCLVSISQVSGLAFAEDGNSFVTVGNRHVKFWYLDTSKTKVRYFCEHTHFALLNIDPWGSILGPTLCGD